MGYIYLQRIIYMLSLKPSGDHPRALEKLFKKKAKEAAEAAEQE